MIDASQISHTGYSLNDILAKGKNNMNKLVEIVIRWYIHKVAFYTGIQKMYNSIKLHEQNRSNLNKETKMSVMFLNLIAENMIFKVILMRDLSHF